MLYRGYIKTNGKESAEKFKGKKNLRTLEEVKDLPSYAGVLADDTILVDIDDKRQSEILACMAEDMQLDCLMIDTDKGKHFLFKNTGHPVDKCATKINTAVGLTVDIKVGHKNSYEVLKINGKERFIEWDAADGKTYQEIPKWLYPVQCRINFAELEKGDGRNQALFNYILTLQGCDYSTEEIRDILRLMNKYVLKDPLADEELEVIMRDEAFKHPVFFKDKIFQFDRFAHHLKSRCNVVKINGQLHIYKNGIYMNGYREIEEVMISLIPNLKKTQRREVIDYLELIADKLTPADARYIAFRNGILDISKDEKKIMPFTPDLVITNMIPWDYDPNAYSAAADKALNDFACNDPEIRALLEECIGYCFYRQNYSFRKAFILTGERRNGKSTFLDCLKAVLGIENISALELKDIGDRFNTAGIYGKLANIGDDISDDFLQGTQVSLFKKIVAGNRIKAERKGQDPFEFEPYCKLVFSANDIPRMRDKTGAALDRLVIIPFNAKFSKYNDDGSINPDFNNMIVYELTSRESAEYMVKLGVEGLYRLLDNGEFTQCGLVRQRLADYEEENNPIIGFIKNTKRDEILNEPTNEVYIRYKTYCADNEFKPLAANAFTRQLCSKLKLEVKQVRQNNKRIRIYVE